MFSQVCVILSRGRVCLVLGPFLGGMGMPGCYILLGYYLAHSYRIDNRLLEVPLQELILFIEITTYSTYQS